MFNFVCKRVARVCVLNDDIVRKKIIMYIIYNMINIFFVFLGSGSTGLMASLTTIIMVVLMFALI